MIGIVVIQPLPWPQRQPKEAEEMEEAEEVEKTEGHMTTYHGAMTLEP